jgi:hypothetical protein
MMRWSIGLAGALSTCALFGASLPACTPPPPELGSTDLELLVDGEGTVSVEETATVCPPTCAASQDLTETGARWTLTATPAEGWEFVGWEVFGESTATCPGGTSASFVEDVPAGGASYACRAVFEPLGTMDPQDLGLDPNGDDALDVVSVDSWRTPDGGLVVGATVAGAWPPDDGLYSWYVGFTLHSIDGAPIGTATLQRHDGTRSTPITGIPAAAVSFVEADDGVHLVVAPPIDATHVSIESGVQASSPGTRVSDAVPDAGDPLPISTRESDPP